VLNQYGTTSGRDALQQNRSGYQSVFFAPHPKSPPIKVAKHLVHFAEDELQISGCHPLDKWRKNQVQAPLGITELPLFFVISGIVIERNLIELVNSTI
jgi:hypothetical protein